MHLSYSDSPSWWPRILGGFHLFYTPGIRMFLSPGQTWIVDQPSGDRKFISVRFSKETQARWKGRLLPA